jgi:hypothetical protein
VQTGSLPVRFAAPTNGANGAAVARQPQRSGQPVGLVHAALASHQRTVTLAERRVEALWAMLRAREAYEQALRGVEQTLGTQGSLDADEQARERLVEFQEAERALQAVEAAWAERLQALRELESAGASVGVPGPDGGAHVRRKRSG